MSASSATLPAAPVSPSSRPASPPPVRRWYQLGVADLVFLFTAFVVLQGARHTMLDDPGLGWHLRNIDAMRAEGWWLTTDPFTEPGQGEARPWRTNQWLGEIPLWLGERWAGLEGIAVITALVLALMMRCFYQMLLNDGLPWPVAALWTALTAVGTSCSWSARPNVFTIFFVLLTARVLEQFHQGRLSRQTTLWLWPLFAVWANIHGGFLAGLILLAATLGIEAALSLFALSTEDRAAARARLGHLIVLSSGAVLATCLNPYGPSLYSWVLQLLGEPYFMELHQEWRSPDFHGKGAMRYELLMLLFPVLLALSARRPNLVELGLAVLWLHFALTGFRYVALWVVVAAPLLARSSVAIPWLRETAARLKLSTEGDSLFAARPGPLPWAWTAAFAVGLLGWSQVMAGQFARHKQEIIAAPALDRFLEIHAEWREAHGRRPVIFHSYDWGGYLTWHGWPEVRNWIDDRNEVQGKERIQDYFSILNTEPGWAQKLDRAGVDLICVESGAALTYRLAEDKRWKERYRDRYAVIFERRANGQGGPPRDTRSAAPTTSR
jgi:hypothetical protein